MRFKGLDLNLLQALDVLLEERHVSRAAERMHVTQPAMSGALNRLRQYFNDPLLTQHGKKMVPTPHALSLVPKLKRLLSEIDALVMQLALFDPASSQRAFKVIASDYVIAVVFPPIAAFLSENSPNLTVQFQSPSERSIEQFEQGEIDLLILPDYMMQTYHKVTHLYDEEQVVLGWQGNPRLLKKNISQDEFFECSHIVVELGRVSRGSYVESFFATRERKRDIAMSISSFLAAPEMLIGTNLITVTHRRLADLYAKRLPLTVAELPFSLEPMRQMMAVHEARVDDPGVNWLQSAISDSLSR